MDPKELVTIYTLGDPHKAVIIKNFLNNEGIRCFVEGLYQGEEIRLVPNDIKIQVAAADADRAAKLIASHEESAKAYGSGGKGFERGDNAGSIRGSQRP
jgi:translation initiation factor RLI1